MIRKLLLARYRPYSTATSATVDNAEIKHFQQFVADWWDELGGQMKPLHSLNLLRVPLIRDGLINTGVVQPETADTPTPLKGFSILDVGCGGGILTEPLARLGARVTGLDAIPDLIALAKSHAWSEKLHDLEYLSAPIEEHADKVANGYDAVVASETLEHVTNKQDFLKACLRCLKPGGSVFVTTMNKTWLAGFCGVFLAEKVFGALPEGTHDLDKFLEPHKLRRMLEDEGCRTILVHGMLYNPLTNVWTWCSDDSICYALHAIKLQPA